MMIDLVELPTCASCKHCGVNQEPHVPELAGYWCYNPDIYKYDMIAGEREFAPFHCHGIFAPTIYKKHDIPKAECRFYIKKETQHE